MRWFWIDRFEEFVRGQHAVTLKNVTFGEEPLDNYMPGHPHYPHSLIIEGMAQTGGLLIAEPDGFQNRVVLAKVGKAIFHRLALPGDQLRFRAEIQSVQSAGAIVHGTVTVDGEPQADLELWFAFLDERFGKGSLFPPADLLRVLRVLRLYDVAVDQEGHRINPPEHLLVAEKSA
ncbi:MAG: 3-hydroxyacyl-ACP dehydratase FabZ family protein [Pirellulaceae bacterium]|nr:3-hydroxyacyl-ACP dehydratase FabZ family protein [Pirellulaceae bacterium]